ncbi:MAG: C40 family peptidase [Nocardioidaceae bacterium]
MTGRHRRTRPHHRTRRLAVGAAGALGATTLVIPLASGAASAATPGPHVQAPSTPHVPSAPGVPAVPHTPWTPLTPGDPQQSRGHKVVQAASEEVGHPYMWGAEGPVAFDCSGLTKYVYNEFGVNLPHNAAEQYQAVNHVSKDDMQPGDLVFIYDEQGIFHVGIYAGGHEMWAAGHTGDVVRKQAIWTDNFVVGRP